MAQIDAQEWLQSLLYDLAMLNEIPINSPRDRNTWGRYKDHAARSAENLSRYLKKSKPTGNNQPPDVREAISEVEILSE